MDNATTHQPTQGTDTMDKNTMLLIAEELRTEAVELRSDEPTDPKELSQADKLRRATSGTLLWKATELEERVEKL